MPNLETLIQQSINPFDTINFKKGNFWQEDLSQEGNVDSIHQEAIEIIQETLEQINQDQKSRTIRLEGDSGSGKTYLLGRVKKTLNKKAFFAHIIASIQSDYIFQYTLRKTIESLMFIPEGEKESQLLLWLRRIINQQGKGLSKKVLGERKTFLNNMKAVYPSGIWKPNSFFNVLYSLTQPDLYSLACGWLKGDDLDEEDLKLIGAKTTIDNEESAIEVLSSFSRISQSTLPIVLCFDEIDISNNRRDLLESILKLNMIIHSQKLRNFLVILSVITDTWNKYQSAIEGSLKAPINTTISLKPITAEQIKALWSVHLQPLHQQAEPPPNSNIEPLKQKDLDSYFPGGKGNPRSALKAGHQLIQHYKTGIITPPDSIAAFKLLWRQELKTIQKTIQGVQDIADAEAVKMLQEVLKVLKIPDLQFNLFERNNSFSVKSLRYSYNSQKTVGLVWYEQANLRSFCTLMRLLTNLSDSDIYQKLILIRSQSVGNSKNKGYKLYKKLFENTFNYHIIPDLASIHLLATYHSLYSFATNKNLTVGYETPDVARLEELTRNSGILDSCKLLQNLRLIEIDPIVNEEKLKEFILDLVKTQLFIGRQALVENILNEFANQTNLENIDRAIETLSKEKQIKIVNPQGKPEEQSICLPVNKKKK